MDALWSWPPLVVNLSSRDVTMPEQLLHLADLDACIEQQVAVVTRREWVL
jgi:hypothetical protein